MLTSERRGSSARRGLQVLGKIPAVPKPINLPSQRLENRGLNPDVEIVPRGGVSWASAETLPPASSNAWGTATQASSPPSGSGAWGPKVGAESAGNSGGGGGTTLGAPGTIARPNLGDSGGRPLSAESVAQVQQSSNSFSRNTESSSARSARPSSASGVLGQVQPLGTQAQAQPEARPRSADTTRPICNLSEFGDQSAAPSSAGNAAWAGRRRLGEEPYQTSHFQLTRREFPTLGSEKNPDLRPQQSSSCNERWAPVESNGPHAEGRRPLTPTCPSEEVLPRMPLSAGNNHPGRSGPYNWRREGPTYRGPPPHVEGNWHWDGPYVRPSYGGQGSYPVSWRRGRDGGLSIGSANDNWRGGGAPPLGRYGPRPAHGYFPHECSGFMHGPRFGPRSVGFGRGAPGPGGYGPHGDVYGNAGLLLRPAGLMRSKRPSMFHGLVPYDGFYGPPRPAYQIMEDPEKMMMMLGCGPGRHVGYGPFRGPPQEELGRFGRGGTNQCLQHHREGNLRERGDVMEKGCHKGQNYCKEGVPGRGHQDETGHGERFNDGHGGGQEVEDNHMRGLYWGDSEGGDVRGQTQRSTSSGHRDWGAAASSDEPMDFSKPVFEEEVVASTILGDSGKHLLSSAHEEEVAIEEVKREVGKAGRCVMEAEVMEEEFKVVVVTLKSDLMTAALNANLEILSAPSSNAEGREIAEDKDERGRKTVNMMVVEKEVVAKMVTRDRWERGTRGDANQSQGREASHPGGNVESFEVRLGPYGGGAGGKASILRNAPRSAVADVIGSTTGMHQWKEEKSGGVGGGLEQLETEVLVVSDKGRILRRTDSQKLQAGVVEGGVSDVNVVQACTGHEGGGKEAMKSKVKTSHDVEKEWRPKVPIAEMSPRRPADVASQDSEVDVAGWASAVGGTEGNASDCIRGLQGTSDNNVDAQRASMREKTSLKASRFAKEEEDRVQEQKMKARTKLEELDRRFTVVPALSTEEVMVTEVWKRSVEGKESRESTEAVPAVELEVVVQSNSVKRNGRNEHAKNERNMKANGWKAVVGEGGRDKANGGASMIPSAKVSDDRMLSTPVGVSEARSEQAIQVRESRHKGRSEKKQVVGLREDRKRLVAVAVASAENPPTGNEADLNMDNMAPIDVDSGNTGHVGTSSSDGPGSLRKSKSKSSRNSRSKQRPESPAVMIPESIQFGDIVSGISITDFRILGSEVLGDSGTSGRHMDVGNDMIMSGDALAGDEGSAVLTNGDVPGKRMKHKSRSNWRQGRSDRGSQAQRAAEKSSGVKTMVWAPVRSPRAGGGTRGEGPQLRDQQGTVSAPRQGRGKRAEMERYSPKHLMKYQENLGQKLFPPHTRTQGVHDKVPQDRVGVEAKCLRVLGCPKDKQSWIGDEKGSGDVKEDDSDGKNGRSHISSWQRSSRSEIAKDSPAVDAGRSGLGDAEPHRQQADQGCDKGVGLSHHNHSGSKQLTAATQVTAVGAPAAGALPAAGPGPTPTLGLAQVSKREYLADKRLHQPPRPASSASRRGQDRRGQDYYEQGWYGSDHKEQLGTGGHAWYSNEALGDAVARKGIGSQQLQRNNGGDHPRSHNAERERASCQQAYLTPHAQQKTHSAAAAVKSSLSASSKRHSQQQQGRSDPCPYSGSDGEQGSFNRRRLERNQETRTSAGMQRGQNHWQFSGGYEGFRSGSSRPHISERALGGSLDSSRADLHKQQAGKSQRGYGSEQARKQQNKGGQRTAPKAIPSVKAEGGNWGGEGGSPLVVHGGDSNHGRRGRFGGRSGPRSIDAENRRNPPAAKQRLVIDATGGAVPSQVGI